MPTAGAKRVKTNRELPWIEPIRPIRRADAFDHPDWLFELKYDGFRALLYIEALRARFMSRNRNEMSRFRDLAQAIRAELDGHTAILDGELVCLDQEGRPMFNDLLYKRGMALYSAFDLLWLDGEDLRGLPLVKRKARLEKLLPPRSACVRYVAHFEEFGHALFKEVKKRDLEGVVAKCKDAPYVSEKTTWYKIKNRSYSQAEGRNGLFDGMRNRENAAPSDALA